MGYVYVISAGDLTQKIGVATDVRNRLANIQAGNHQPLSLHAEFEAMYPHQVERRAHALLSEFRLRGEWFSVSPEVASAAVVRALAEVGNAETSRAARRKKKAEASGRFQTESGYWFSPAADMVRQKTENAALCRALLPKPLTAPVDTL